MNEMIERVARAIAKTDICGQELWEDFEPHAKAVLKSIREPNINMLLKGKNTIDAATLKAAQISITQELMKAAWESMIDEALK